MIVDVTVDFPDVKLTVAERAPPSFFVALKVMRALWPLCFNADMDSHDLASSGIDTVRPPPLQVT